VRGEVPDVAVLRAASTDLLAVPAVLGSQNFLLLLRIEVAVRPTEIVAALDAQQLLGRQLRALFVGVELRPACAAAAELDLADRWTGRFWLAARRAFSNVPDFAYTELSAGLTLTLVTGLL